MLSLERSIRPVLEDVPCLGTNGTFGISNADFPEPILMVLSVALYVLDVIFMHVQGGRYMPSNVIFATKREYV